MSAPQSSGSATPSVFCSLGNMKARCPSSSSPNTGGAPNSTVLRNAEAELLIRFPRAQVAKLHQPLGI
jgi:hypothetical protein